MNTKDAKEKAVPGNLITFPGGRSRGSRGANAVAADPEDRTPPTTRGSETIQEWSARLQARWHREREEEARENGSPDHYLRESDHPYRDEDPPRPPRPSELEDYRRYLIVKEGMDEDVLRDLLPGPESWYVVRGLPLREREWAFGLIDEAPFRERKRVIIGWAWFFGHKAPFLLKVPIEAFGGRRPVLKRRDEPKALVWEVYLLACVKYAVTPLAAEPTRVSFHVSPMGQCEVLSMQRRGPTED